VTHAYEPRGAARDLFFCRDPEVLLSGPAGTGKSRACLQKLDACARKYAGMRGLMVRKTRESLTQSALVTFEKKVLPPGTTLKLHHESQEYRYPNGSVIVVGGLDKASKIMSTEYDQVYVQEAIELAENDWESLTTRLRNNVIPYQQLHADTNPDAPTHWLKKRCEAGKTRMLDSRHEDNPTVTPAYLAALDALTGVRRERLRHGRWVQAEGVVYEGWDRRVHLIDRDQIRIRETWPRYWSIDFGYSNPFTCLWWAEDPDGRLYRYRELYQTHRLVEDHAKEILRLSGWELVNGQLRPLGSEAEPRPRAVICDHDAEDRATLKKHLGLDTVPAKKAKSPGIQAVASRLKVAGDGRPRLFLVRDALVRRDPLLEEKKLPCCTEEEIDSYVWDTSSGRKKGEEPVDRGNHGLDSVRYLVAHHDLKQQAKGFAPGVLGGYKGY
jgi:hypothetical protein